MCQLDRFCGVVLGSSKSPLDVFSMYLPDPGIPSYKDIQRAVSEQLGSVVRSLRGRWCNVSFVFLADANVTCRASLSKLLLEA
eukprot:6259437-Pyramimonas_sp.AAC.1